MSLSPWEVAPEARQEVEAEAPAPSEREPAAEELGPRSEAKRQPEARLGSESLSASKQESRVVLG